ncbi:MAG: cytochrome c biogenesis protein CcsA [Bacteroidales bacterium]|nr:cytochrome c biogenesis protein CcsA [Bacteroidales bacterium]
MLPLFVAILLIVAGGLCTWFTARSVHVHLREGETNTADNSSIYEDFRDTVANFSCKNSHGSENSDNTKLPFSIRLDKFDVDYYEGTHTIKDYISYVTVSDGGQETKARISMNKIMKYRHYRIFQEDYDSDLDGSVLLVRYDPWGNTLVYIGFALLLLSMIWLLLRRDGAFRSLLRALSVAGLLLLSTQAFALPDSGNRGQGIGDSVHNSEFKIQNSNNQLSTVNCQLSTEEAEAFGQLSVYYRGRIAPFDSYARDYCKATFPKGSMPKEYNPVQLVTAIYLFPENWPDKPQPSFKIFPQQNLWLSPEDDLSKAQNEDTLFIAHILDWLRQSIQEEQHKQNIQIINSIARFQEKRCTPGSINRSKERIEITYNQFNTERKIFLAEIILVLALFILLITASKTSWLQRIAQLFVWLALILTLADIVLRCYLSGHGPFSGTFDTMLSLAAITLLVAAIFGRKKLIISFSALTAAAFVTLAASLMGGRSFSPLMPVLISPWLTVHVSILMTAYSMLTFTFILALISISFIILKRKQETVQNITNTSRVFCIIGVVLLTTGIIIGSAWANISWGQYWSWDPKETWALITLLGYCAALPGVIPAADRHPWLYHLIILIAFGLLIMTYLGINLFGGMHAY